MVFPVIGSHLYSPFVKINALISGLSRPTNEDLALVFEIFPVHYCGLLRSFPYSIVHCPMIGRQPTSVSASHLVPTISPISYCTVNADTAQLVHVSLSSLAPYCNSGCAPSPASNFGFPEISHRNLDRSPFRHYLHYRPEIGVVFWLHPHYFIMRLHHHSPLCVCPDGGSVPFLGRCTPVQRIRSEAQFSSLAVHPSSLIFHVSTAHRTSPLKLPTDRTVLMIYLATGLRHRLSLSVMEVLTISQDFLPLLHPSTSVLLIPRTRFPIMAVWLRPFGYYQSSALAVLRSPLLGFYFPYA